MKHLNPRQGITTLNRSVCVDDEQFKFGVKHLNPRQGITTVAPVPRPLDLILPLRVKHLNPRQGITTRHRRLQRRARGHTGV